MSIEQAQRTFVCGVVSVDLVGYSKLPVSDQIDLKDRFNACLGDTLRPIAADGRIILDTGDGVVVGFLNDPEDALFFAMALSRASEEMAAKDGLGRLRIGINLGPVRLGTDLNQHPTLVGDGVNVAEQIMAFARPGTVVASRAFHDFAARLSGAYQELFHFEGSRTDRHVRDHEIYTVRDDDRAFQVVKRGVLERAGLALPQEEPTQSAAAASSPPARAPAGHAGPGAQAFLRDPAKVGVAAFLLASIALLEGYLLWGKLRARSPAAPAQVVAAPAPAEVSAPTPTAAPESKSATPTPAPRTEPPAKAISVAPVAPTSAQQVKPAESRITPLPAAPTTQPAQPAAQPSAVNANPPTDSKPKALPSAPPPKSAGDEKRPTDVRKPTDVAPEPKRAPRKNEPAQKAAEQPVAQPVEPPPASPPPAPVVAATPLPQPAQPASRPLEPISRAPVDFPITAVRQGVSEGRVKARATIDAAGNVLAVEIVNAYPQRLFDRAVVESVSRWKFPPGAERRSYEVDVEFKR